MRYLIEVSYDGTDFCGWQVQKGTTLRTVQSELDKSLSVLLKHPVYTMGSSRTDAGVHASQNYAHFEYDGYFEPRWLRNLNFLLPDDIGAKNIYQIANDSHARFDAIQRSYIYRISYNKNPLWRKYSYYYPYPKLYIEALQNAAEIFLKHSYYRSFSKKQTNVTSFECKIKEARWSWNESDELLEFHITANRFLRGMVRAIVQTSIRVARRMISLEDLSTYLEGDDNRKTDFAAPANGLTLKSVVYPSNFLIPLNDAKS